MLVRFPGDSEQIDQTIRKFGEPAKDSKIHLRKALEGDNKFLMATFKVVRKKIKKLPPEMAVRVSRIVRFIPVAPGKNLNGSPLNTGERRGLSILNLWSQSS